MLHKKDGFDGQRAIVLPKSIINKLCLSNELISNAFITDIGYYPRALYHLRKRPQGAEQNILIYCVEGTGKATIKGNKYRILPGDYFVIPHGTPHSYETEEKNPWTIYWCHFRGGQTDRLLNRILEKSGSYKARVDFIQERINLFNQLYTNLEQGYSYDNLIYTNILFLNFFCSFLFDEKYYSSLSEKSTKKLVDTSITYMQNHLDLNLTLAELSTNVNTSPSYYSFLFKKETGFPPIEYFNHLKIQKACQFLQFTDLRIREIAFKIGIEDAYYFSRLFTKTMGVSPKEYRDERLGSKQDK